MNPRVSICLPTLNRRAFLPERMDSIRRQTLPDWEVIAVDSYSDDGTFEALQQWAREDWRVHVHQAERDGVYTNINRCIERARGDYVYIATSDDTMAPDCLEKLVAALDAHPECDIGHCEVRINDDLGRYASDWWARTSVFARTSGALLDRCHVRRAPFDGLLHLLGGTVFISLTQIVVRRSLFERIGRFDPRWGSVGDFHWNMRACLVSNIIHVPGTWAGFRIHAGQATAAVGFASAEHLRKIEEMIADALAQSAPPLESLRKAGDPAWWSHARDMRRLLLEMARCNGSLSRRLLCLLGAASRGSAAVRSHLANRLLHRPRWPEGEAEVILNWLQAAGQADVVTPA